MTADGWPSLQEYCPVWVLSSIPAPRMWNEETRSYHIVWKLTDKGRDVIKELEQQRN
jgi:hypothetical protein